MSASAKRLSELSCAHHGWMARATCTHDAFGGPLASDSARGGPPPLSPSCLPVLQSQLQLQACSTKVKENMERTAQISIFFSGGINKSEWTDIKVRAACTTSSSRVAMPLLHFIYRKKWMKKKNGSEAELLSFACCEAREKIHASMRTSLSFARDLLAQSINVIGSILFVLRF